MENSKKERKKETTDIDIIMGYSISHEPYESYHDNLNGPIVVYDISIKIKTYSIPYSISFE